MNLKGGVMEPAGAFPTSGYVLDVTGDLSIKTSSDLSVSRISVSDGAALYLTNSTGTVTARTIALGDDAIVRSTALFKSCEKVTLGADATMDITGASGVFIVRNLSMGPASRFLLSATRLRFIQWKAGARFPLPTRRTL